VRASLTNYSAASGLLRLCLFEGAAELGCSDEPAGAVVALPAGTVGGKTLTARITGDDARTTNGYTFQVAKSLGMQGGRTRDRWMEARMAVCCLRLASWESSLHAGRAVEGRGAR
jgi:hypothetical protein